MTFKHENGMSGYYVYALVDPRDNKIFYVGKGRGDRVFRHARGTLPEESQSLELDTIRSILDEVKSVTCYILRHKLTEETACTVESTLANLLTNKDFDYEDNLLTNIEGIMTTDERNKLYDHSKIKPNREETAVG